MKRLFPAAIVLSALTTIAALSGCSRDTPTDPAGVEGADTAALEKSYGEAPHGRHGQGGMRDGMATYEVIIENLTPATGDGASQPFSPPILAAHDPRFGVFRPGQLASPELAMVAEDANNGPLVAQLEGSSRVEQVVQGDGVILPGGSMSFEIRTDGRADRLSAVFMLVNTNDGFGGLDGVQLPASGERSYWVRAWDAGSERNTELASDIPGPCCGSHGVRVPTYERIRPHRGIQGGGDLDPAVYGWDGPVAKVTVRRLAPAYEITLTNLTPATGGGASQPFSPPLVATVRGWVPALAMRGYASDELITLAEDGDAGPLAATLEGSRRVSDLARGDGPVLPGGSVTFTLTADARHDRLALACMLVNTNDGFTGVAGLPLPAGGSMTYDLVAWDAGSEQDTELAADIPGPCCGSHFTGPDEHVRIMPHAGIQGGGDLDPAVYGWDGPVASLTVTRVR
ncbi:MAG TPA: spondin domain-containing protein [Candidatus Krumholzibacteria bacterium]|nr:spondin domain-containing protein [Candidatus Krumholzibacteria bacterium]